MENEEKVIPEVEAEQTEVAPAADAPEAEVVAEEAPVADAPVAETAAEEAPAADAPAEVAASAEKEPGFFARFIHDFVNYFKNFDAERIMHWCQGVFIAVITIVMTNISVHGYYNSISTRKTFEKFVAENRPLMVSFTLCAGLTWIFVSALIAWGVGKLFRKRFKQWFEY